MTQALEARQDQSGLTILDRVKRAVVEGLDLEMDPRELADDESLFGGLGADSIAALEIVAAIEDEFGFEVEDEDLTEDLMASVASLTAYVERATGGPAAECPAEAGGGNGRLAMADDVPVRMKTCPNCNTILQAVDAPGRPRYGEVMDAAQHAGLETGICPDCGVHMTGIQPR